MADSSVGAQELDNLAPVYNKLLLRLLLTIWLLCRFSLLMFVSIICTVGFLKISPALFTRNIQSSLTLLHINLFHHNLSCLESPALSSKPPAPSTEPPHPILSWPAVLCSLDLVSTGLRYAVIFSTPQHQYGQLATVRAVKC